MFEHRETRLLPYTPRQLFELVMDIESYPQFLPWCQGAQILARGEGHLTAEVLVGYKALRETFRCEVYFVAPKTIEVKYLGGPLTHLQNQWQFRAKGRSQCEVEFMVDFGFKSRLLAGLMQLFFDYAFLRMVNAFEARAATIYGRGS